MPPAPSRSLPIALVGRPDCARGTSVRTRRIALGFGVAGLVGGLASYTQGRVADPDPRLPPYALRAPCGAGGIRVRDGGTACAYGALSGAVLLRLRWPGTHQPAHLLPPRRGADLVRWAEQALRFRRERGARSVYVLLNNHYAGCSAQTVRELQRLMGLPVVPFPSAEAAQARATAAAPIQLLLV
jgi:hypothetical protein